MIRRAADHPRQGLGGDDRQLVAEPQAVDQAPPFSLGGREPAREDVVCIHARRIIQDQHNPPGPGLLPAEDRVGQREN